MKTLQARPHTGQSLCGVVDSRLPSHPVHAANTALALEAPLDTRQLIWTGCVTGCPPGDSMPAGKRIACKPTTANAHHPLKILMSTVMFTPSRLDRQNDWAQRDRRVA
jgi:hypothetical protein